MKRRDLIRHLEGHGCALLREGGNHAVYVNRVKSKSSTIPRHREINDFLARKICRDLEVPEP
jgi:predicted RNA binding protein YcfA (HicA-like mRNA interferase family)